MMARFYFFTTVITATVISLHAHVKLARMQEHKGEKTNSLRRSPVTVQRLVDAVAA
jgi:hypothetical protein